MNDSLSAREKKFTRHISNYLDLQIANDIGRSTKKTRIYSTLDTTVNLWKTRLRYCLFDDSSMHCSNPIHRSQEGNPTLIKDKKIVTRCSDNFVPVVAVIHQRNTSSSRHDSVRRNSCVRKRMWRNSFKITEHVFESLIDDDTELTGKTSPHLQDTKWDRLAGKWSPSS